MEKPLVIDQDGQERDWEWLIANFGAVTLERAEAPEGVAQVYRIVKLADTEGPAAQVVNVVGQDGEPLEGITVVRHWPDAPPLPDWPPPTSRWRPRGVYGQTGVNGDIGFGMGHGDYYFPPDGGASAVWLADEAGPSDLIGGLGMIGATNHRHLDIYYRRVAVQESSPSPTPEPAPKPQPTPTPIPVPDVLWDTLLERLNRIVALLEQIVQEQQ